MLIEFKVTNFRSFRDTQVFSMVASADQTLLDNTVETSVLGKQRLLRSATMYGANASGKSNLVKAFVFLRSFLTTSTERKPGSGTGIKRFALDPAYGKAPSEFEITFIQEGVRYQYGISLDSERIHTEWLIAYPRGIRQVWYERSINPETNEPSWYFGPRYTGERQRLTKLTRPDVPFLNVATAFNHKKLRIVFNWFYGSLLILDPTAPIMSLGQVTTHIASGNENILTQIEEMIKHADLGIEKFLWNEGKRQENSGTSDTAERTSETLSARPFYEIEMYHRGQDDTSISLPLEEESLGTRRFFGVLGFWTLILTVGGTLVIDELDASLHPTLMRTLIQMFHDPEINEQGAQLIFNTHDTTLLDTGLFRRDQFWFVEKDHSGASHIYSLLEYSPRKDEALERGYLQGRYGAIPDTTGLLNPDLVHD